MYLAVNGLSLVWLHVLGSQWVKSGLVACIWQSWVKSGNVISRVNNLFVYRAKLY